MTYLLGKSNFTENSIHYLTGCDHMQNYPNYYNILGVPEDARPEQIKKSYYQKSKLYHPDNHSTNNPLYGLAVEKQKELDAAHEVLSDPLKRIAYDQELRGRDSQFRSTATQWREQEYKQAQRKQQSQYKMVLIPAGEFQMGDHFNEGHGNELPVHTVYLDAFYMDIYEVTNAQYGKFMNATGHSAPRYWNNSSDNAPEQPVVGVSWHDAVAYAEWAGKRLPTEAEWEKAARGGLIGKRYPWGDEAPDAGGVYRACYGNDPVGSFAGNGYGLYDMAGSVYEWCADWYDGNYYSDSPNDNPLGPGSGTYRVLRGGSWYIYTNTLRVAYRPYGDPAYTLSSYGFRCVSQD